VSKLEELVAELEQVRLDIKIQEKQKAAIERNLADLYNIKRNLKRRIEREVGLYL
jgi:hypothetical protein